MGQRVCLSSLWPVGLGGTDMDLSPVGQLELMVAQVIGLQVVVGLVTALGLYCWRAIRH